MYYGISRTSYILCLIILREEYKLKKDVSEKLAEHYCLRFGKIAVDMGFITEKQLREAIDEQIEDHLSNKSHRLIGYIFLENGWVTNEQINIIENELSKKMC